MSEPCDGASRRRFGFAQRLLSTSGTGQAICTGIHPARPEEGLSLAKARLEGPETER